MLLSGANGNMAFLNRPAVPCERTVENCTDLVVLDLQAAALACLSYALYALTHSALQQGPSV